VRSRKKVETENPLLPRYLFVGLKGYGQKEGQDFYKLRGIDGVESVVRNEGVPVIVQQAKAFLSRSPGFGTARLPATSTTSSGKRRRRLGGRLYGPSAGLVLMSLSPTGQ
jgi:transcription antitermination factor NusG